MTVRPSSRWGEDCGQAAFATLGFLLLLLGIVGLATDVGCGLLVQQRFQGDADAAALAASTAISPAWVGGTSDGPLDAKSGRILAAEALHLRRSEATPRMLRIDGQSVTVEVTGVYRPPILGLFGLEEVQLSARSSAIVRSG